MAVGIAWVNMRAVVALLLRKTLSDNIMAIMERKIGNPVVRKCHGLKLNVVEDDNLLYAIWVALGSFRFPLSLPLV